MLIVSLPSNLFRAAKDRLGRLCSMDNRPGKIKRVTRGGLSV
jgi:hypothetical protein